MFYSDMSPSRDDIFLYKEGNLFQSYKHFGAHLVKEKEKKGVNFRVWVPNAKEVRVIGDFNDWNGSQHVMQKNDTGFWTLFVPGLKSGDLYKYEIITQKGEVLKKADPYAFYSEIRPNTASIVYPLDDYHWQDEQWQTNKKEYTPYSQPINIYEVHLGSWRKKADNSFYNYRELAPLLINYVLEMGYTHIEILPLAEHPLDESWGYQGVSYYSITSRYGTPHDFMYFVDQCHQSGIGVILDWVPGHFCKDEHGLCQFDGTPLYEYAEKNKAEKVDWGTLGFDLGKKEVQSYLISNAIYLMDIFHIDGLRVDAVASMLYLDFGKKDGNWTPNRYGGNQNLEAIEFLRKLNEAIFHYYPSSLMMAEESTSFPLVSAPTYLGGLGFNFKWNMGWMNDMLHYMEMDPIYRKYHHQLITFSFFYTFSENYILPLSHDEVVHGKRSLLNKMFGDYWQKFAGLRLLYGYMMSHPGKKLMFMGGEFAQYDEWKDKEALDWNLLEYEAHQKMHHYVRQLNHFYLQQSVFWELDHHQDGFEWIDPHDTNQSIITFMRKNKKSEFLIVVCNFTPVTYQDYLIGVPSIGQYQEIWNSDQTEYGGTGIKNDGLLQASPRQWHNQPNSLNIRIPPLSTIILKRTDTTEEERSRQNEKKRNSSNAFGRG